MHNRTVDRRRSYHPRAPMGATQRLHLPRKAAGRPDIQPQPRRQPFRLVPMVRHRRCRHCGRQRLPRPGHTVHGVYLGHQQQHCHQQQLCAGRRRRLHRRRAVARAAGNPDQGGGAAWWADLRKSGARAMDHRRRRVAKRGLYFSRGHIRPQRAHGHRGAWHKHPREPARGAYAARPARRQRAGHLCRWPAGAACAPPQLWAGWQCQFSLRRHCQRWRQDHTGCRQHGTARGRGAHARLGCNHAHHQFFD